MTPIRAWGVAMCLAIAALVSGEARQSRPRRDPALEALVAETANVQPEFAADILIRVATSEKATDPVWKRELLEQAFQHANAAHDAYRRTAILLQPDTRPGALMQAYDMRLDRISLQARIVLAMLPLDPDRALELFDYIDFYLRPASCDDPLIPVADEYYNALAQLSRYVARGDARARADAFQLLVFYMWRARLPSEMPAIVGAIRALEPDRLETVYLDGVLRSILAHSERDARGFSSVGLDLVAKLSALADDEQAVGLTPAILMTGARQYLIEQLTGPRCADSLTEGPIAVSFNAALKARGLIAHDLQPIGVRDMQPSAIAPPARIESYWRVPDARRLHDQLGNLHGPDRQPLTETKRRAAAWKAEADAFLVELDRWTGARELTEADNLYQRGVLFASLFDLSPHADLRARAIRGLIDALRHSMVGRERPALWFLPAARLLDSERGEPRRQLIAAFEQSGQATLVLYAHASRIVPPATRRTNETPGDSADRRPARTPPFP